MYRCKMVQKFLYRSFYMYNNSKFDDAKKIIRQGIKEQIDFMELRNRLPGWRKRALQSLIFDIMGEMNMLNVPFPGLLKRPKLTRKPIQISSNGEMSIQELLEEKGFRGENCLAYAHIGKNKITLTVKQKNI